MATPARLKRIEIEPSGPEFTLHIEDENGRTTELLATRDQLDLLADFLDDALLPSEGKDAEEE